MTEDLRRTPRAVSFGSHQDDNEQAFNAFPEPIPIQTHENYAIEYIKDMSRHFIDTGKDPTDTATKVVLLACEVERLNTININLVKENEILKAQSTDKSVREKELEVKLAVCLAEIEKLNQIIEDINTTKKSGAPKSPERHPSKLAPS